MEILENRKIVILTLSLIIDLTIGEPSQKIHPVVITGKVISLCLTEKIKSNLSKLLFGLFLIIIGNAVFLSIYFMGKKIITLISSSDIPLILFESFIFKTTFALRSLIEHSNSVFTSLKENDIVKARKETSKIVGRKTEDLDKPHIISASVESVAENTVDSFFSPIFFFLFFGIPGSIFYRVLNTLDAMVGYKNEKYKFIGFFPAKTDDILNFIPARLSILFILSGAIICRYNIEDSVKTLFKYRRATPSPNSYIPICLFSGALGIKLEKIGFYSIGDFVLPENEEYIRKSNILALISCILFFLFSVATMYMYGIMIK